MTLTKKAKLEQFDAVQAERDLMWLYLYDTTWNVNLDATEKHAEVIKGERVAVRGQLFRTRGAMAGYVVIRVTTGHGESIGRREYITCLDDCNIPDVSEYTLCERIVLDRLRVARNKILRPDAFPAANEVSE
jgi:hypothetical protein